MAWYTSILPAAVSWDGGVVRDVLLFRDIEKAIDHAPALAGPWALMAQYTLPFDTATAMGIWEAFGDRFLTDSADGTFVTITPESEAEDVRATCLATWLAHEVGDEDTFERLLGWADSRYEPRSDPRNGEFGYWFGLGEPQPRGQWNNVIMNAFVAEPGTWQHLLD